MRIALPSSLLALALVACGEDPCADYVDYMCDCHPEEDCEELQTIYEDADADLQEECVVELEDQQTEDDQEGVVCGEDSGA